MKKNSAIKEEKLNDFDQMAGIPYSYEDRLRKLGLFNLEEKKILGNLPVPKRSVHES